LPQASYTVTVNRPAADVFAFVADGEKCSEWRPGVVSIRKVSGDGAGATYEQRVKGPCNRPVKADYQITEFQPDTLIAFETISGPVRPRGRYELQAVDGGTRLTMALEADLRGFQKMMGGPVQKSMDAEVHSLDKLKQILGSG
jgi:carbon monoxide dehydrogenase subunit G